MKTVQFLIKWDSLSIWYNYGSLMILNINLRILSMAFLKKMQLNQIILKLKLYVSLMEQLQIFSLFKIRLNAQTIRIYNI